MSVVSSSGFALTMLESLNAHDDTLTHQETLMLNNITKTIITLIKTNT